MIDFSGLIPLALFAAAVVLFFRWVIHDMNKG